MYIYVLLIPNVWYYMLVINLICVKFLSNVSNYMFYALFTQFLWKHLVIMAVWIWFLPSVYSQMFSLKNSLKKPYHTCYMGIISPDCVFLYVFIKVVFHSKSLITLATLIWSFPNVCSKMNNKIIFLYISLVALAALLWFLPSVQLHMPCKIITS